MASTTLILFLFAVIIGITNGWWFNKPDPSQPDWDKLSVTFLKFNELPKNIDDAKTRGWVQTDECKDDAYFRGNRYILGNDFAVMLLFDSKGTIAGIQNGVPKSSATHGSFKKPYWVEDGSMLVVTAYFVDPKMICAAGRDESKYVGDSLHIQTGASPSSVMTIPLKEDDVAKTNWVYGKCVPGMGKHYWYNISKEMNCDDTFPSFLLYNGGKLNAFGWATIGDFHSDWYEHPPTSVLGHFFQSDSMPTCITKMPKLSTIHIYFQRRPYLNLCVW